MGKKLWRYLAYSLVFLVLCVLILGLFFFWLLIKKPMPQVKGEINLPGLKEPVEVLRDSWGVAHIFARNESDLFFASGYVQAQDRLFQIYLLRGLAEGRLAEIFGDIPEVIKQDKFARTIGLYRLARSRLKDLSPESKMVLESFSRGVNAFLERRKGNLPIEFNILSYQPSPWTPEDTVAIGLYIGWGLSLNWELELIRYQLALEQGREKAFEILPRDPEQEPYIIQPGEFQPERSQPAPRQGLKLNNFPFRSGQADPKALSEILKIARGYRKWFFGLSAPFASNSWVVAGSRTKSGKPILANDPHLELTLPSIWYEIHLKSPEYEAIGALFPGVPMVVLGHTRKIAWSATTTCADMDDLFILRINPENPMQYLGPQGWENFKVVEEKIKIRTKEGFKEEVFKVRLSRYGPVLNDVFSGNFPRKEVLALRWTGAEPRDLILSLLEVARAENWEQFRKAIFKMGTPIQNWSYADANGNIGYISAGLYPIRFGWEGDFPVRAETSSDWKGYLSLDQVPQVHNPERGYIITANNEVMPRKEFPGIISYKFCPPYRAERILELLLSKDKLTIEDMMQIQYDHYSKQAERLAPVLIKILEKYAGKERKTELALRHLKKWDYNLTTTSPAPTIFFSTYWRAFQLTYQDEMSPEVYEQFARNQFAFNGFDRLWLEGGELFERRDTPEKESREQILYQAFHQAVSDLEKKFGVRMSRWQWGRVHTLKLIHPLGSSKPLARWFDMFKVNQGAFPVVGGWNTVNNSFYSYQDNVFKCFLGPSFRHIIDFGDLNQARFVITGGNSGQPWNMHYSDQTRLWLEGKYHLMPIDRKEIERYLEAKLVLKPGN